MVSARSQRTTAESVREYARGVAGGLLFSLPLLYTMEVWWAGFQIPPERLLAAFAGTFVLLLGYNRFAGLREDASWTEVVIDSIEELGLGLIVSAGVLYLLGRIGPGVAGAEAIDKILIEALVVAIGVSVGTAQLGDGDPERGMPEAGSHRSTLDALVLSACGSVLFAANVAPTEEIVVIAAGSSPLRLAGLALLSIACIAMIFYGELTGDADADFRHGGHTDLIATYGVSLAVAASVLWVFGRFDEAGPSMAVAQTVVLGFPSALGGATGRLILS